MDPSGSGRPYGMNMATMAAVCMYLLLLVIAYASHRMLQVQFLMHEELLRRFLRRSKALAPAGAADSDSDSDADEEEAGGDGTPCAQCGRTYPHKHVRAVYSTPTHPDGDDEGSGDDER